MAKAVPADGTKTTHAQERERFKVVSLGVLYGLSAEGIARKLNTPPCAARELLEMHQSVFRQYWRWSDAVQDFAMLHGYLQTVFGWCVYAGPNANPRSMRNFPMQANGAEMMRLACCLTTERGIRVCAPVHDALLIEAPEEEIEAAVTMTQEAMREASLLVLPQFPLRTEVKVVRHPARYSDPRGERMWATVMGILADVEAKTAVLL
jgi:DNA polymerase I-like protein with 3'-5' exonuclease and polymerase domains